MFSNLITLTWNDINVKISEDNKKSIFSLNKNKIKKKRNNIIQNSNYLIFISKIK